MKVVRCLVRLCAANLDLTIGLAIKTTGKTAISVEYDALRNIC
jgi:hypothetical protein